MTDQLGFDTKPEPDFVSLPEFRFRTSLRVAEDRQLSQRETVEKILRDALGFDVCGTLFHANYLYEARARIAELRRDGAEILSRSCEDPQHRHKTARIVAYRWVSGP